MGRAESRPRERHGRLSFAARRAAVPPPPASSPPPFRFRPARPARAWRAGVCALGALAAVLVLLLGAGEAEAQTSVLLVGNSGHPPNSSSSGGFHQEFTTGSNALGYTLDRVNIRLSQS